jgi:hypothetical protein
MSSFESLILTTSGWAALPFLSPFHYDTAQVKVFFFTGTGLATLKMKQGARSMRHLIITFSILLISMLATAAPDQKIPITARCHYSGSSKEIMHTFSVRISFPDTYIGLEDNENAFVVNGHWDSHNSFGVRVREARGFDEAFSRTYIRTEIDSFQIQTQTDKNASILLCKAPYLSALFKKYDAIYDSLENPDEPVPAASEPAPAPAPDSAPSEHPVVE